MPTSPDQLWTSALRETARALSEAADIPLLYAEAIRQLEVTLPIAAHLMICRNPTTGDLKLVTGLGDGAVAVTADAVPDFVRAIGTPEPHFGAASWPNSAPRAGVWILPLNRGALNLGAVGILPLTPIDTAAIAFDGLRLWSHMLAAELARRQRLVAEQEGLALRRFTQPLVSKLDLRAVFPVAIGALRDELQFDEAALYILDENRHSLRWYSATAPPVHASLEELPLDGTASGVALAKGEPVVVDDTAVGQYAFDRLLLAIGCRSHSAYPLLKSGRIIGSLNLVSRHPRAFSGVNAPLMESVCSTLALAVDNALLFERMQTSEDRYSSLVESSRELIYRLDASLRFVFFNQATTRLLGRVAQELTGTSLLDFANLSDDGRRALAASLPAGDHDGKSVVLTLRTADGREIVTSHRLQTLRDERDELTGFQGIAMDRTREEQADRATRMHRDLVDALDDYVFMADASGALLAANKKARETLGWEADDIEGMTILDLHPPHEAHKVELERRRLLKDGAATFDLELRTKGGATIPTRARVTYSPESGTLQGVFRDISEEKLVQERLFQVERLRALGEMASGVAHTLNNLLAVIGTTVEVALSRVETDHPVREELAAIQQAVMDGGAAVQRIQDFTRERGPDLESDVDLNALLEQVVRVTRERAAREQTEKVEISAELGEIPRVRGNEAELRDVFRNLTFNAVAALKEGGTIIVRSKSHADRVLVEVVDSGRGITPEVRKKIFTPFFSTKGERGAGLGLAIALNVVSKHAGTIEVETEPGRGTTMRVSLPEASVSDRTPVPARLLLAVGEPLLRIQLEREIRQEGHTVVCAATGEEALRRLEGGTFDCALVDFALAPPGALPVADVARARGARVVLLADWAQPLTEETLRRHRVDSVLRKPFPTETLLNLIQTLRSS